MNTSSLSWLFFIQVGYLVVASIVYIIDRTWGRNQYRRWYDFTHEEALSGDTIRGFICGRPARVQVWWAFVLSILTTIGMAFFIQKVAIIWFFTWLLGFPTTIIGFILGPMIAKLWAGREKVYDTIDQIEEGKTPEGFEELKNKLVAKLTDFWPSSSGSSKSDESVVGEPPVVTPIVQEPTAQEPVAETPVPASSAPKNEDELSWEEKIARFTGGKT